MKVLPSLLSLLEEPTHILKSPMSDKHNRIKIKIRGIKRVFIFFKIVFLTILYILLNNCYIFIPSSFTLFMQ